MHNIILYQYIKKKAKEVGLIVSYPEIKNKLHQFDFLESVGRNILLFLVWKDGFSKSLGASANIPFFIIFSAEWAVQLVINNSEDTINAFKITIGHELAHKDGDFKIRGTKINRKFISWVTEVHHDFSATEKMVYSNKERLLASIDYKINAKPNNEAGQTHPSWKQRKVYAETGLFNEKLIRIITSDVGCADEDLIKNVIDYHYDINLK